MTRYIFSTVFGLVISLTIPQAIAAEAGRYQLFQGEYRFVNLRGEEHWIKALFKIDTATGKLFICEGVQLQEKNIQRNGEAYQRQYCAPFEEDIQIPVNK
jgi:hypothetical protein